MSDPEDEIIEDIETGNFENFVKHFNDTSAKVELKYNLLLRKAAIWGDMKVIRYLVENRGISPSTGDNIALIAASHNGQCEVMEYLLKYPEVNPAAQDNLALEYCDSADAMEILLRYPNVNPAVKDNSALIYACKRGQKKIVKLLLEDPRIGKIITTKALTAAVKADEINIIRMLLLDGRVDPSGDDNLPIITASFIYKNNEDPEVMEILLSDPRINLSKGSNIVARNMSFVKSDELWDLLLNIPEIELNPRIIKMSVINNALSLGNYIVANRLLKDKRTNIPLVMKSIKDGMRIPSECSKQLNERIRIDMGYGLINTGETIGDRFVGNDIGALKYIVSRRNLFTKDNVNYVVNTMLLHHVSLLDIVKNINEDSILEKIVSYLDLIIVERNDLVEIFSKVTAEDLQIKRFNNIFSKAKDTSFLLLFVRTSNEPEIVYNRIASISIEELGIGHSRMYSFYKSTAFNEFELKRPYNIVDIICRRDDAKLKDYILDGGYLPYSTHAKSKIIINMTDYDAEFAKKYMFNENLHTLYLKGISVDVKADLDWYIYDSEYAEMNANLRSGVELSKRVEMKYNNIIRTIMAAPPNDEERIIYRGIDVDEYQPELLKGTNLLLWRGISSCSSIREISDQFTGKKCCIFIIIIPKGANCLNITSIKNSEDEILLPPFSLFQILRNEPSKPIVLRNIGILLSFKEPDNLRIEYYGGM